ncbi:3'-5' exonuclease [Streptomyces inusitatus]|uniref:3'-5' exonuclease n=1 Tax=Streptomyces inusitatus TaxID=68221 RepID=A0A918UP19_9ACTN|nr:exonuclease domain-containing protein [Streptomyces inusitatus]GGZ23879.1 3'-5' exonuclease [Streptomyces inusitatus]
MTWADMPWVGFDLETTGVEPEVDRIVTAAVVSYDGGRPARVQAWVSDAGGVEIPPGATAIHGYTTEAAREAGRPAAEVVAEVTAALAEACEAGRPLVVMNAAFDLTMIETEADRYGLRSLFGSSVPCVLDPKVLDKQVDRYRRGKRRLEDLCAHWAVPHGSAHDAVADAVAACAVTTAILDEHPELKGLPLDELHERQARWYADQQEGLRGYFESTPHKRHLAASVRTDWPIVPARPGFGGLGS